MGYSTRSQGQPVLKYNMAAHFWHFRIPLKNSTFLHNLETYYELKSIQILFAEVHS